MLPSAGQLPPLSPVPSPWGAASPPNAQGRSKRAKNDSPVRSGGSSGGGGGKADLIRDFGEVAGAVKTALEKVGQGPDLGTHLANQQRAAADAAASQQRLAAEAAASQQVASAASMERIIAETQAASAASTREQQHQGMKIKIYLLLKLKGPDQS